MSTLNPIIRPKTSQREFLFEPFILREYNFGLDPDRPICKYYNSNSPNSCPNGNRCPNKHVSSMYSNKIVCKHWLRGLCKKNDNCEFLHEYNLRKMPECLFFTKNGFCTQTPECLYLHIDPNSKVPECQYYSKGFCPDGPNCSRRHVRKKYCLYYLTGFCPQGPNCENYHPAFDGIPDRLRIKPDKKNDTSITDSSNTDSAGDDENNMNTASIEGETKIDMENTPESNTEGNTADAIEEENDESNDDAIMTDV